MSWFTKKVPVVVTQDRGEQVDIEQIGWIPVSDKVPEYQTRVLVSDPEYGVVTGCRIRQDSNGDSWELGVLERCQYTLYRFPATSAKVTHWMPMPPRAR